MNRSGHEDRLREQRFKQLRRRKICYFVYGNEGSGTRLAQRIIASDPTVYDDGVPGFVSTMKMNSWKQVFRKKDKIVVKRDGGWQPPVDLRRTSQKIREFALVHWIWTLRRPAKFELGGKPQRFNEYLRSVGPGDLFCFWDNSLLFVDPENFLNEMALTLNLNFSTFNEEIFNPDIKYLKHWGAIKEDK